VIFLYLKDKSVSVFDTTLCDKVCQLLATSRWFFQVSSANKTEILLKVALNNMTLSHKRVKKMN